MGALPPWSDHGGNELEVRDHSLRRLTNPVRILKAGSRGGQIRSGHLPQYVVARFTPCVFTDPAWTNFFAGSISSYSEKARYSNAGPEA